MDETGFTEIREFMGLSLDETYVKIKGSCKYLYRAVDKAGATADFLLTAKRDSKAVLRFLR
jgi:putative transposase